MARVFLPSGHRHHLTPSHGTVLSPPPLPLSTLPYYDNSDAVRACVSLRVNVDVTFNLAGATRARVRDYVGVANPGAAALLRFPPSPPSSSSSSSSPWLLSLLGGRRRARVRKRAYFMPDYYQCVFEVVQGNGRIFWAVNANTSRWGTRFFF